jgi:hypothetical protein
VERPRRWALAAIAIVCVGCSGSDAGTHSETVSRADFGSSWPFTVERGVLACEGAGAVTFEAGGTTFAVNGIAAGQDFADIEPIWRDDPESPGLKINIGPVIDRGLDLCDQGG